ncbi:hypothetical protein GCM10023259_064460 [Thermocatellispora tengchongensis]
MCPVGTPGWREPTEPRTTGFKPVALSSQESEPAGENPLTGPVRFPSPAPTTKAVLEEENKQLKARIWELEMEHDILRRAAKYFAGETNW